MQRPALKAYHYLTSQVAACRVFVIRIPLSSPQPTRFFFLKDCSVGDVSSLFPLNPRDCLIFSTSSAHLPDVAVRLPPLPSIQLPYPCLSVYVCNCAIQVYRPRDSCVSQFDAFSKGHWLSIIEIWHYLVLEFVTDAHTTLEPLSLFRL